MKINLVVIRTNDIDKLADFYQKLGITFQYHQHGKGPFHYAAELAGTVFEIYPLLKSQEKPDNSLRLGFDVARLDELIASLIKEKVEILKAPTHSEYGYVAIIKDLDGRKIELKQNEFKSKVSEN